MPPKLKSDGKRCSNPWIPRRDAVLPQTPTTQPWSSRLSVCEIQQRRAAFKLRTRTRAARLVVAELNPSSLFIANLNLRARRIHCVQDVRKMGLYYELEGQVRTSLLPLNPSKLTWFFVHSLLSADAPLPVLRSLDSRLHYYVGTAAYGREEKGGTGKGEGEWCGWVDGSAARSRRHRAGTSPRAGNSAAWQRFDGAGVALWGVRRKRAASRAGRVRRYALDSNWRGCMGACAMAYAGLAGVTGGGRGGAGNEAAAHSFEDEERVARDFDPTAEWRRGGGAIEI
ncbi:hypothetical protein B0H16DRAFT_1456932 [Mycena metata]|uniref:Uncharacterized protein n=1 Tax=Mycena metata TaxID=1033252 RepID=A0AAD7J8X6_9AGAR|nr:hypothetical protein B0H16DRAFT_1456932 [Mycena metata]